MNKIFTQEELKNIEKLVSKYSFGDVAKKLNLSENQFLKLRKELKQLKEAVDRGISIRGDEFKNNTKKKISDSHKGSAAMYTNKDTKRLIPDELDPATALAKFKEEFKANKRKRLKKDLNEIYFI